jgi:hypothetical protein
VAAAKAAAPVKNSRRWTSDMVDLLVSGRRRDASLHQRIPTRSDQTVPVARVAELWDVEQVVSRIDHRFIGPVA